MTSLSLSPMRSMWTIVAAVLLVTCAGGSALAEFTLKGRTVNFIIGGGVGGGIDLVARAFSQNLARHLPGEPIVVASNMPGNGGIQGAQYVFNVVAKDGSAFGMVNAGPVIDPLTRGADLGYDARRLRWLGSLQRGDTVCSIWHTSPVKTIADARTRETPLASAGATSSPFRSAMLMNALIGTRFKPISGFDGGNAPLAIERGEVEGMCNQLASQRATRPDWLKSGKLKPIVQLSMSADPEFPDAPRAWDLVTSEADRHMLDLYQLPWEFNHAFMLPPGAPEEAVAAWRTAFDRVVKDPAYLAEAERRGQKIEPRGGAEVQALVDKLYATPRAIVDRLNAATTAFPK